MPPLKYEDITNIISNFTQLQSIKSFYESGTYYGSTSIEMQPHFNQIITVEVSVNLYKNYHQKLSAFPNISHINGASEDILYDVLNINHNEFIFFLDGHYSSGDTGSSNIEVPLLEELNCINKLYKKNGLIIIDDFNLFETTSAEDWSNITINNVIKCFTNNQINSYFILNNRMIIVIDNQ
jgi:hypothetical protein